MELNINTDELVIFTNKLERLHKSALPIAIRGALNNAAFDVKQRTMLKTSKDDFVNRQPNFFKATSKVKAASGFDMGSMQSEVGFTDTGLKGEKNFSVKDLEQQERGGTISGRSFIPLKTARGSNSDSKPVRPSNRISDKKNLKKISDAKGSTWSVRAIKTAVHVGVGGFMLATGGKGPQKTGQLWRVKSIERSGGRTRFKVDKLYSFSKTRKVTVHKTNFMKRASLWSASNLEKFFIEQAERQFAKL